MFSRILSALAAGRGRRSGRLMALGVVVALVASCMPAVAGAAGAGRVVDTVKSAVYPPAGGSLPLGPLAGFDEAKSRVVSRSERSTVYARPDGLQQVVLSPVPVNWQDPSTGVWSAIDSTLVASADGRWRNTSGPFSVSFAAETGAGELVRVERAGRSLGFSLEGAAAGTRAAVRGSTITYAEIVPNIDLEYSVSSTAVKEVVVVKGPVPAGVAERFRFRLSLEGLEAAPAGLDGEEGVVLSAGGGGEFARIGRGVMADASGRSGGVRVDLVKDATGTVAELVPDPGFARKGIAYPWRIDPPVFLGGAPGFDAFVSSASPTTSFDGLLQAEASHHMNRAGFEVSGGPEFASYQQFDLSPLYSAEIVSAAWKSYAWSVRGSGQFTLRVVGEPWSAPSVSWNSRPAPRSDGAGRRDASVVAGTYASVDVTDWLRRWIDPNGWENYGIQIDTDGHDRFVKFGAMEGPANVPVIEAVVDPGPAMSFPSLPFGSILTATPTLTTSSVSGVQYAFRVATGTDGDTNPVITSELQSSQSWTVPAGVLRDGGTYYWKAYTFDGTGWTAPTVPARFSVNRRLGMQAASPMDTVGPVSVNAATGNLVYQQASPEFETVGRPIGVSFSYNSQADAAYGLEGAYYANCDGSQPWTVARPTARRQDSGAGGVWAMAFPGAPIPGSVATNAFCVRWTGFLTVPAPVAGESFYRFKAVHDDHLRVVIDGVTEIDASGPATSFTSDLQFAANRTTVPIVIELVDTGGPGQLDLHVEGVENRPLPVNWLSVRPPVLPAGWSPSLDVSAALSYTSAMIDPDGDQVALYGPGGEPSLFEADSSKTAWTALNGDQSTLTRGGPGGADLVVHGADGMTYVFDSRGTLTSATAAADPTDVTAHRYTFDGNGRVVKVADPTPGVSRELEVVYYTGPGSCPAIPPGFDAVPPPGHVCELKYSWDGTSTKLFYQSGRLGAIVDPGDPGPDQSDRPAETRFGYDPSGRLASIRRVAASDLVNVGLAADDDTVRTLIVYSGDKVSTVTLPVPEVGAGSRDQRSYRYVSAAETQIDQMGVTQPHGFSRKVTFNGQGQVLNDTDATNLVTRSVWDANDRLLYTVDPADLETDLAYDGSGRVIAVFGPAPFDCFADYLEPTCPTVPLSITAFDEGINGLAAKFWSGPGDFTASPKGHSLAFAGPPSQLWATWTGNPPGVSTDQWTGRFTGIVTADTDDWATLVLDHHAGDRARVWLNDSLVIDRWAGTGPNQKMVLFRAGFNRLRIDYADTGAAGGSATAEVKLSWIDADGNPPGQPVVIPGGRAKPDYGLVTSTTDPDGKVVRTEYAEPHRGLPTATIAYTGLNGTGTALRTVTEWDPVYPRRVAKRLPRSAAPTDPKTTYQYFSAGDPVPANECGITGTVSQVGRLRQVTEPGTGGIVRLYLSDQRGRTVGTKLATDPRWTCTTLDSRGRTETVTNRAGQETTISYPYAQPLTVNSSFPDSSGATRTTEQTVDLLGRSVRYRDEHGVLSTSTWGVASRLYSTARQYPGQVAAVLTHHAHDPAGRPTSFTEYAAGGGRTTTFSYEYGRLDTITRPNGTTTDIAYDDTRRGEVSGITHARGATVLSPWTYTRTKAGTIATEATTGRTRTFTYDGLGRLTRTVEGAVTRNYAYDANSNRCNNTTSCTSAAYTYGDTDRLTGSTDPRYSGLAYSPEGNLTAMGGTTLTYDPNDHVTVINDGTTKVEETLSPSGRVLERKVTSPPGGAVQEWLIFGYDGTGDSPAYEQTTGPSGPTWPTPVIRAEDWSHPWSDSWLTDTDGTATVDVTGGRGRLRVSGGGDARAMLDRPPTANSETVFTFEFSDLANRSGLRVGIRGCNTQPACDDLPMNSGYRIDVVSDQSTVSVRRIVGGSHTTLPSGTFSFSKTAATKYRMRVRLVDYTISVKIWKATDPEPAQFTHTVTDGDTANRIGGTGHLHLHHNGTSGTRDVLIDDLVPTDATKTRKTHFPGPGGLLVTDTNAEPTYYHANAHGDIAGTTDLNGTFTSQTMTDEYGKGTATPSRLGWLGTHQRPTAHPATGFVRMGVRLYDPNLGRFTSTDPIEGGCLNDYAYVADPVNQLDLDGARCPHAVKRTAGFLSSAWIAKLVLSLDTGNLGGTRDALVSAGTAAGATVGNGEILSRISKQAVRRKGFATIVFGRVLAPVGRVVAKVGGAVTVGIPAMGVEAICNLVEPRETMEVAPGANWGRGGRGIAL